MSQVVSANIKTFLRITIIFFKIRKDFTFSEFFYAPGRWWGRRRFASLIPSVWRLTPIHKAMGGHASHGPTTGRASTKRGNCRRDAATPYFWKHWFSMSYKMRRGNADFFWPRFHALAKMVFDYQ